MSEHMSIHMSVHMSAHVSTYISVHLSVHMPVHMFAHVSACTSVHMSVHMSVQMLVQAHIHAYSPLTGCCRLLAWLCMCMGACLYTCLYTRPQAQAGRICQWLAHVDTGPRRARLTCRLAEPGISACPCTSKHTGPCTCHIRVHANVSTQVHAHVIYMSIHIYAHRCTCM